MSTMSSGQMSRGGVPPHPPKYFSGSLLANFNQFNLWKLPKKNFFLEKSNELENLFPRKTLLRKKSRGKNSAPKLFFPLLNENDNFLHLAKT